MAACVAVALAGGAIYLLQRSSTGPAPAIDSPGNAALGAANDHAAAAAIAKAHLVCGQSVLRSPFSYAGSAGHYASGTPGLPTYGDPHTDFPLDSDGVVLPTGNVSYQSFQLAPDTVYYLLPGTHIGNIQADKNDAFVGGYASGQTTILTGNYSMGTAIDSDSSDGNQSGVVIEYLTIEKYTPYANAGAVNQEANTGWTIRYNTVTRNVPGAGIIAGSENTIMDNCLTQNGQYGFQSENTNGFGLDPLTHGTYDVKITGNEISFNDTCDFSGLLNNSVIGWKNYDPVPAKYRNPRCGKVVPDGDQGGFKLWATDGVTVAGNYIHDNWGVGGWADTDNANTTWTDNVFARNENTAITEEVSYNFGITGNTMLDNDWADGLNNPGFPQTAIYISESGSDTTFGGIPACPAGACAAQRSYQQQSVISGNTLVNNGGGIFLWQDANRHCGDGYDAGCTLVFGAPDGQQFRASSCSINLPRARLNLATFAGEPTGSPRANWWDGCMWRTANVRITNNTIDFDPAQIPYCNSKAWPDCGANGIFSQYGGPATEPGWAVATELTFFQHDTWSQNVYNGPSTFWAWNQGNGLNPVSWQDWTGHLSAGDECTSSGARSSGFCGGPFGQDVGSTYNGASSG